jgi:topoisomerase-4 subunit A
VGKKFYFINEGRNSKLLFVSTRKTPTIILTVKNDKKEKVEEEIVLSDFIDIKGWKSTGNKLTYDTYVKFVEVETEEEEDEEVDIVPTEPSAKEHVETDGAEEMVDVVKEVQPEEAPLPSEEPKRTYKRKEKKDDEEPKNGKTFTSGDQLNLL